MNKTIPILVTMAFFAGAPVVDTGPATVGQRPDPRATIFVKHGCTDCHTISGLGRKTARDTAPDLTFSYGDVVARYGMSLEAFLADPPGTMQLVLASRHRLGVVDRDSMVAILRRLYEERRAGF
jgi:hypothetical protein